MSNEKVNVEVESNDEVKDDLKQLSQKLFYFILLIAVSVCNTAVFKLSQNGGEYQYNTISAMVVVESIKLCISFGQCLYANGGDLESSTRNIRETPTRTVRAYAFLALSYAGYNQLIFAALKDVDPGTFSLFKSLIPAVVGLMNWVSFGHTMSKLQMLCLTIQMLGIVPVIMTKDLVGKSVAAYSKNSILVMISIIVYGSFNTVYNAAVVKKESESVPVYVQNSVLYGAGSVLNCLFYFCTKTPERSHFFFGYNNIGVIMLLCLNSTAGIIISFVYKYGDAVLKTLAQPMSSSLLVFISYFFFDLPLDIVKASGAGVVILSTFLFIELPAHKSGAKRNKGRGMLFSSGESLRGKQCVGFKHICFLFFFVFLVIDGKRTTQRVRMQGGTSLKRKQWKQEQTPSTAVCIRGNDRKVDNADNILRTIVTPLNADVFAVIKTVNGTAPDLATKLNVVVSDYENYSFGDILAELEANGFNKTFWLSVDHQNALGPLGGSRGSGILQYQSMKRCYEMISDYEKNQREGEKYNHIVVVRSDHYCAGEPFCISTFNDSILIPEGSDWGGLNDRLIAIPRRAAKLILTGAWQKLLNNSYSHQFMRNSEFVVKANVEESEIEVIRTNITCFLACVPGKSQTSWSGCKELHINNFNRSVGLENLKGIKDSAEFNAALDNSLVKCQKHH